jgi:hypothetical protein
MGAELFHGNGRTDRQMATRKPIVAFHNFAKAPKTRVTFNLHTNKETWILPIVKN